MTGLPEYSATLFQCVLMTVALIVLLILFCQLVGVLMDAHNTRDGFGVKACAVMLILLLAFILPLGRTVWLMWPESFGEDTSTRILEHAYGITNLTCGEHGDALDVTGDKTVECSWTEDGRTHVGRLAIHDHKGTLFDMKGNPLTVKETSK
ncbi:hypothetical protein [Bifidobacterium felsineum]|uniref:hypothetical protein n=1 Tax=Bifidobacterium felsineum TaxID=2045440 RepID=UPI001BDBE776|nr:hypothetical protein [Bifidobacterium felsineum]MBT1164958.1 hypothetical protein [Bifidobacterium felsineum]